MPKTYKAADHTVHETLREIIEEFHPTLHGAHVSVAVLMVAGPVDEDGTPKGAALSRRGHPVNAIISITSVKNRALGMADAVIEIDEHRWDTLDEAEQKALLDQQCEQVFATIGEDSARTVKSDACDRPVLSKRAPDFHLEGYTKIMQRHGRNAPEAELVAAYTDTMKQASLPLAGISTKRQEIEDDGAESEEGVEAAMSAPPKQKRTRASRKPKNEDLLPPSDFDRFAEGVRARAEGAGAPA